MDAKDYERAFQRETKDFGEYQRRIVLAVKLLEQRISELENDLSTAYKAIAMDFIRKSI